MTRPIHSSSLGGSMCSGTRANLEGWWSFEQIASRGRTSFPPRDVGFGRDLASAEAERSVSLRTIRLSVRPTTHANRESSLLLSQTSPEGRPRHMR